MGDPEQGGGAEVVGPGLAVEVSQQGHMRRFAGEVAHPMGVMADPLELVAALRSLGAIDRALTGPETAEAERRAGGRALWRLECAQHLALLERPGSVIRS